MIEHPRRARARFLSSSCLLSLSSFFFVRKHRTQKKCKALSLRSPREATPPACVVSLQNLALLSAHRGGEDALFGFIVHLCRRRRRQQQQQCFARREDAIFIFT
jgi:hypothetical protein